MLLILCDRCGEELIQPGALAFSPPDPDDDCGKYHICKECWTILEPWLWNR